MVSNAAFEIKLRIIVPTANTIVPTPVGVCMLKICFPLQCTEQLECDFRNYELNHKHGIELYFVFISARSEMTLTFVPKVVRSSLFRVRIFSVSLSSTPFLHFTWQLGTFYFRWHLMVGSDNVVLLLVERSYKMSISLSGFSKTNLKRKGTLYQYWLKLSIHHHQTLKTMHENKSNKALS